MLLVPGLVLTLACLLALFLYHRAVRYARRDVWRLHKETVRSDIPVGDLVGIWRDFDTAKVILKGRQKFWARVWPWYLGGFLIGLISSSLELL